jgi:hypothetical protein
MRLGERFPDSDPRRSVERNVAVCLLLATVVISATRAGGQDVGEHPRQPSPLAIEKERGASRIVLETELAIELEIAPKTSALCEAHIRLEYTQRDTVAGVRGTIENPTCAASGGTYTIAVTVRDAGGTLETLAFAEPWRRLDERPVTFSTDYPIGENVDLVSVRVRGLRCSCTDPLADERQPARHDDLPRAP